MIYIYIFLLFCSKNIDPLSASYATINDSLSLFKKQYSIHSVPALSLARYGGYKVLFLKCTVMDRFTTDYDWVGLLSYV